MISFTVNLQRVNLDVDPSTPLLWVLRENLGLTGTKYGCGMEGHGVTAEKCSACHQDHNLAGAHMPPGTPNWGLPPPTTPMIWEGLSDAEIYRSFKDPKQNKNRNSVQLVEHLTEDKLVAWAWNPGEGRTPIPMSHEEYAAKVKRWPAAGAPCPADTGKKPATTATRSQAVQHGFRQQ